MAIDPYPRDLQPTIYTDPRTIYTQGSTPYDSPNPRIQPATAAASVPSEPVSTPTVSTSRQQAQQLATRTANAVMPAAPIAIARNPGASADDVEIGNIVYQSLQRPKLLRGGEWQLSMATNLIAAGFVILAIMQWNWRFLPGALFFGGPIQWLLRVLADRDPKYWQKYIRSIGQPLIRKAHGKPGESAPAPRILPKPSWFIH